MRESETREVGELSTEKTTDMLKEMEPAVTTGNETHTQEDLQGSEVGPKKQKMIITGDDILIEYVGRVV